MDAYEIARRANVLPDQFATRLPAGTVTGLRQMKAGGEHGELVIELTATLARTGAAVTAAEQRELRALLAATGMPTYPADQLTVAE
jgi:hypothetical protein